MKTCRKKNVDCAKLDHVGGGAIRNLAGLEVSAGDDRRLKGGQGFVLEHIVSANRVPSPCFSVIGEGIEVGKDRTVTQ